MWWRKICSLLFTVNSSTVSTRLEWMWIEPSPILTLRAWSSMSVGWDQGRAPTCSRFAQVLLPISSCVISEGIVPYPLSRLPLWSFNLCRFWSRTTLVWKTEPSWSQCVTWDPRFLSTVLVSSRLTLHHLETGRYLVRFVACLDHQDVSLSDISIIVRQGCNLLFSLLWAYFKSASFFSSLNASTQHGLLHRGSGWISRSPWDVWVGS